MRKVLFILGALSLFAFMSCQQPTNSADKNSGKEVSKWGSLELRLFIMNIWVHGSGMTCHAPGPNGLLLKIMALIP